MTFPVLKTGASAQYPLKRALAYRNEIHRYVDGSEQRYRDFGLPLREWTVELELLDEGEMETLAQFIQAVQGRAGEFVYVDPMTGVAYEHCSLASDENEGVFDGELRGRTQIRVRQNRT